MRRTLAAAATGLAAGIALGSWLAFREMSTVIVGTVDQYRAQTNVDARATGTPRSAPVRRPRPSGRDPIDPQTESSALCACAQRLHKGEARVSCPVHGPSVFDSIVAEVPALTPGDLEV